MAKVNFTNKDVADRFDCHAEKDIIVHAKGYSGRLSKINPTGAEAIAKSRLPYVTPKAAQDQQKAKAKDSADVK